MIGGEILSSALVVAGDTAEAGHPSKEAFDDLSTWQ